MKQLLLLFAWLIALIAMLSTLFASEIMHLPVCPLCWYQRIAIYPLVILLGISAYKNETAVISYMLPFPIIGFLFATYQYLEQMIPEFSPIDFCTQGIPCNTIHFKLWGFVTMPFLSAVACAIITGILFFIEKTTKSSTTAQ